VTASTALAILALLVPAAGERTAARGWFVRFAADPWTYAAITDDGHAERTRLATFVHLGDDGTAMQLTVTVREDTASRAGGPELSSADGFAVWSGTWKGTKEGTLELDLAFRLSSNVIFVEPPGARKITAEVHGRHLVTPEGPLMPLAYAYPTDAAPLRKQLFETCCSVPGRDPACRTVRR
jgi:hypothetical protein